MSNSLKSTKAKKGLNGCFITIAILIVIPIIVFNLIWNHKYLLTESESPDGSHQIVVKYEQAFLFGSSEVYVYYKKKNSIFKRLIFKTSIANDGKSLNLDCYEITWDTNTTEIRLMGEEQEDEVYRINFLDKVTYELIQSKKTRGYIYSLGHLKGK